MAECRRFSVCSAGQYEFQAPSSETDRSCASCPAGKYQPLAEQMTCLDVTECGQAWETLKPTITSDRECTLVEECENSVNPETGLFCECPVAGCSSCATQKDGYEGVLLVRKQEQARSDPLKIGGQECIMPNGVSNNEDAILGCRDLCQNHSRCVAFSVYMSSAPAAQQYSCCLKSRYVLPF